LEKYKSKLNVQLYKLLDLSFWYSNPENLSFWQNFSSSKLHLEKVWFTLSLHKNTGCLVK
jgi:hypothetical protein